MRIADAVDRFADDIACVDEPDKFIAAVGGGIAVVAHHEYIPLGDNDRVGHIALHTGGLGDIRLLEHFAIHDHLPLRSVDLDGLPFRRDDALDEHFS